MLIQKQFIFGSVNLTVPANYQPQLFNAIWNPLKQRRKFFNYIPSWKKWLVKTILMVILRLEWLFKKIYSKKYTKNKKQKTKQKQKSMTSRR